MSKSRAFIVFTCAEILVLLLYVYSVRIALNNVDGSSYPIVTGEFTLFVCMGHLP